MTGLENIPWWGLVLLAVLSAAQIGLQVWAIVALLSTADDRLRLIPNRWVWLALILLTNAVGAVVFLAAGRKPMIVDVPAAEVGADPVRRAVAVLYGDDDPALSGEREGTGSPQRAEFGDAPVRGPGAGVPRRAVTS